MLSQPSPSAIEEPAVSLKERGDRVYDRWPRIELLLCIFSRPVAFGFGLFSEFLGVFAMCIRFDRIRTYH